MNAPMSAFQQVSNACVKCGKCIPGCTIYRISGDETRSPRGFIDLLGAYQRGELTLDKNAKDIFESCFLCTHCVSVCPSSLPTDELIEAVRADIAKTFGITWYKRAFFSLLSHRKTMNFVSACGAFFAPLLFRTRADGMVARLPLPFVKNRVLPSSAKRSFLQKFPETIPPTHPTKNPRRVAIFIGCLSNYNYVQVGESLLAILDKLGIEAFLAKGQSCCGAPAHFTGDKDTVRTLIERNVTYFETIIDSFEAVLVPEATCAAMIVHDWQRFAKDDAPLQARIQKLTPKFMMASVWLQTQTQLPQILAKCTSKQQRITYHDPCHARKVLGVFQEPRALLAQNYALKEMADSNACCGFGGITIQTERFALAQKVGKNKAQMIAQTGAEIVSAECNACRMQLVNAMHEQGVAVRFAHPLELIAEALRGSEEHNG